MTATSIPVRRPLKSSRPALRRPRLPGWLQAGVLLLAFFSGIPSYDARNRKAQEFAPSVQDASNGNAWARPVTTWVYDQGGRVTATIDARNNETDTVYDAANRLGSVSVPVAGTSSSAAVTYTYDELGRVTSRSIDGANPVGTVFDAFGRVTNVTNALAPSLPGFQHTYIDASGRLSTVTDPVGTGGTGQSLNTTYNYYGNTGDLRLSEIKNLKGTTPLSDFQYAYNAVGTIKTWQQQADGGTATLYTMGYDNADQLSSAVQTNTSTNATVSSNAYNYDAAGNRSSEQTLTGLMSGTFNNLNQLTGYNTANAVTFTGSVNKPTTLTVNGNAVTLDGSNNFSIPLFLPSGPTTVTAVAQDSSGNKRTNHYSYNVPGTNVAPTYDYDGNTLTDEKGYSYTWDALNRLIKITYPSTAYSTFAYDGLSRRVQIVERDGTSSHNIITTKNYVWIGSEIAEERDASNNVTKRFFPQGEQQLVSGTLTPFYYTRDHLASVREMCSSTGTITSRMSYDPMGRVTVVLGTNLPQFQYGHYFTHQASGLNLTQFRAYDSTTGRWLSRDPMGEDSGLDLYSYVGNNPTQFKDSMGLRIDIFPNPNNTNANSYNYPVTIIYHNDPGECCKNVKFIQTISRDGGPYNTDGTSATPYKNGDPYPSLAPPDPKKQAPQSAGPPSPFYPYQYPSPGGGQKMDDAPGGNLGDVFPDNAMWTFRVETCAYCLDDPTKLRKLGCVRWGYQQRGKSQHSFQPFSF